MNHCFDTIPGWTDPYLESLYSEVVQNAPDGATLVEVGAWLGRSTAYMAVEIANSGKDLRFFTVDTWKGSPDEEAHQKEVAKHGGSVYSLFLENIAPVRNLVATLSMSSAAASKLFQPSSVHFVFIDAQHSHEAVTSDILAWMPNINTGGILAGHDYGSIHPGVKQAVDELLPHCEIRGTCWIWRKP